MTDEKKWTILIPPLSGAGTATTYGPFASEGKAWQFVERLPTAEGVRARVIHDQPPK